MDNPSWNDTLRASLALCLLCLARPTADSDDTENDERVPGPGEASYAIRRAHADELEGLLADVGTDDGYGDAAADADAISLHSHLGPRGRRRARRARHDTSRSGASTSAAAAATAGCSSPRRSSLRPRPPSRVDDDTADFDGGAGRSSNSGSGAGSERGSAGAPLYSPLGPYAGADSPLAKPPRKSKCSKKSKSSATSSTLASPRQEAFGPFASAPGGFLRAICPRTARIPPTRMIMLGVFTSPYSHHRHSFFHRTSTAGNRRVRV
ncbi:hypothetical protein FB451DRAFT_1473442 [Mycena latifolia]|nr:hypothetical protein FB451DRAFT_1473442 [Mycena latifolia]